MEKFEKLLNDTADEGICVDENYHFNGRLKGLYIDGNIALSKDIDTTIEKACVLAEELGHHHTTVGNIIDLNSTYNAKQERQARFWAYNKLIGISGLISAYDSGYTNRFEIARFLDVTEDFLQEAIDCYRDKYGISTTYQNYFIMFIPNLMIGRII